MKGLLTLNMEYHSIKNLADNLYGLANSGGAFMKNYILTGVLFILMQVLTFVRRFLLENCESITLNIFIALLDTIVCIPFLFSIAHLVFKKKKKLKHAAYIVIAVVIVYFFISYCRHILG